MSDQEQPQDEQAPAGEAAQDDGPAVEDLDKDPAYQPQDPGLAERKGG
jgi:hypothetical protein